MSEPISTPQVDLSQPVDRATYDAIMTRIAVSMNKLTREYGWCSERHTHFIAVMGTAYGTEYVTTDGGYDYEQPVYNPETAPVLEDYAGELKAVRATILAYANRGRITIDSANDSLTAAGLPPYTPEPGVPAFTATGNLPEWEFEITANGTHARDVRAYLYDHIRDHINAALAAYDGCDTIATFRLTTSQSPTVYTPRGGMVPASELTGARTAY